MVLNAYIYKYLKTISFLIFLITLYLHINYYLSKTRFISLSIIIYQFVFRNIIVYELEYKNFIAFVVFLLVSSILLWLIYYLSMKNNKIGLISLFCYVISIIPFFDSYKFGL